MKNRNPTLPFLLLVSLATLLSLVFFVLSLRVMSQTRERRVNTDNTSAPTANPDNAGRMPALPGTDVVKVDVDLVTVDALVLQKNTARVVGGLKKEDFVLLEDGTKQEITHFSQDSLPLSVLLLIDRGGCLDPFGEHVRRASLPHALRLRARLHVVRLRAEAHEDDHHVALCLRESRHRRDRRLAGPE